jgi:hypothetical protein
MAAFWAVFIFGGSGIALTAHGSLDLKQEIQRNSNRGNVVIIVILTKLRSFYFHLAS